MPLPHGLYLSGVVRGLVENVTGRGRPPLGRPSRAAGTTEVEDRIDALARDGGAGRVRNVLADLDLIKGNFDPTAVETVRSRLAELLGTFAGRAPSSPRLRARLAGEPFDASRVAVLEALVEGLPVAELLDLLREQHGILMGARPDKHPGQFKQVRNYAGGYQFVEPELLPGTLKRGFDALAPVTDPLHRAVAMMFLVTECHPFDDGNGRVARIAANAELSATGQIRIIVPTVYRNNYLAGLSAVSNRAGRGEALVAVLRFAQRWVAAIDWTDFDTAHAAIQATNGYLDPGLAESTGQRLRLPGAFPTGFGW